MKVHDLLLDRHTGGVERRHDGCIAVDERDRRWCLRLGDRLRRRRKGSGRFPLDCCDREAVSFLATTGGISGDDLRDLMVAAVEASVWQGQSLAGHHRVAVRQRQLLRCR
jgi:putative transposase